MENEWYPCNLYSTGSKYENLHNYTLIDVGYLQTKLNKLYTFFYHTPTNIIALNRV